MSNSPYVRASLARAALESMPPLIRRTLIDDATFRAQYGFGMEAVISLGDAGVSVQRSNLFRSIRQILARKGERKISDTEGREWRLTKSSPRGKSPVLHLERGKRRVALPDFSVLSPSKLARLRSVDSAANDVGLPEDQWDRWRQILGERALDDDEVAPYHDDLRNTPLHAAISIRRAIESKATSVSSLVPSSRSYYERLVGTYDGSPSVREYAQGSGRRFMTAISKRDPLTGFHYSLLLSAHSALSAEINVDGIDGAALVNLYDSLKDSDRVSQVGAIEVGMRILPKNPEIEPALRRLIEVARDDDVNRPQSLFRMLSALFVLVDGELSRLRLFADAPPFYRRLASLAHASLICRQIGGFRSKGDSFYDWAWEQRGSHYYMQSLADMRLEPRWHPDLATPFQLRADCLGRIMNVLRVVDTAADYEQLNALVFGDSSTAVHKVAGFPYPYLPGPLEGGEDVPSILPPDLSQAIETQLRADRVSFVALVNSALIFRLGTDTAALAAEVIQKSEHRLPNVSDTPELLSILSGLALVAAGTRNRALTDELRILVRRYQSDPKFSVSSVEAMRICLIAAASSRGVDEWTESAGDWLTELSFRIQDATEGRTFHSHLSSLCHSVPSLWKSCGKADAALKALCG